MIDELLAFGQDRTLNLYPHRVESVVAECIEECRPRAVAHAVDMQVTAAADTEITLDKHKIKQALGNVLDNAIDAAPQGSVVEVDSAIVNGSVRVTVRDHGEGVVGRDPRPPLHAVLHDQAKRRRRRPGAREGAGHAHGGRLEWEAAHPGARFVITLPRV